MEEKKLADNEVLEILERLIRDVVSRLDRDVSNEKVRELARDEAYVKWVNDCFIPGLNHRLKTAENAPKPTSESDQQKTMGQPMDFKVGTKIEKIPGPGTALQEPKLEFRLANGKVGELYDQKIESSGSVHVTRIEYVSDLEQQADVTELSHMSLSDLDLGLQFDASTQRVFGTPKKDGAYNLFLQYKNDMGEQSSGKCHLAIIGNPADKWKNLPQDETTPYGKKRPEASKYLFGPGNPPAFQMAAASRRGRSHAHIGSYRDDDFFVDHLENGWAILIVADGAGSAKYSREGSYLAATTTGQLLRDSLNNGENVQNLQTWLADFDSGKKDFFDWFYRLFQNAAKQSIEVIEAEAKSMNGAGNEARARDYATTLLAVAVHHDGDTTSLATFWMGDGAIAVFGQAKDKTIFKLMGTPDSGEYAGQTRFLDQTALTDQDFGKRISIGQSRDISHILLMTDGISDPKFETDSALADAAKWSQLVEELSPLLNASDPDEKLLEWMKFYSPGHHDDRTIAVWWLPTIPTTITSEELAELAEPIEPTESADKG